MAPFIVRIKFDLIMSNAPVYLIYRFIDKFTPIYSEGKEENPMPENTKLTVYCEGNNIEDRGFIENVTTDEMGLEALIAKSWIKQSDLDTLLSNL